MYGAILIAINAYIAQDLFGADFIRQFGSIESSFIALASYIIRNAGDLTWYPLWFGGMPFHNVYQPGMHFTVAASAIWFCLTPQHAYHLVSAVVYSLAPFTLFWFCDRATGLPGYAFAAGLMYSVISTSALLSSTVWNEIGGPFHSRRFQTMVGYGEGPHIMATALLPVALLCVHRAVVDRRRRYFPLSSLVLACLVLTNWPGTVGLTIALVAFCLSNRGAKRIAWLRLMGIAFVAYLLACRWIPPSTILLVPANAQQSDYSYFRAIHLLLAIALLLGLAAIHVGFQRRRVNPFFRFGVYFALLSAVITLSRLWFGWNLFPQGHRFQIEMEMGLAMAICYVGRLLLIRLPSRGRFVVIAVLVIAAVPAIESNRQYARAMNAPMDMTQTSEYRMAQAFRILRPNDRVFGPGNVGLWMNLWTDTPQVSGCCDQGIPDYEHRISDYTIYSGQNTGSRDAQYSLTWLRAYGATAVGATGPASTDMYRMRNPLKFEGVLPVIWRNGDDVIYDIPQRSRSLAHVIPRSAIITQAPRDGLDTAQLDRYVATLDNPEFPIASFTWPSRHSAIIRAIVKAGQVLSIQVSYDDGWNARVNGIKKTIERDKIGQMVIDPGCTGPCEVDLVYDGGMEASVTNLLQISGIILAVAMPFCL